jgi:protocatechuate 3,4-dioxygenase beta subunit
VKTSPEGTFDFGKQAAWSYLVVARAERRRPASAKVRTGDPTATPPPDKLILVLDDCDAGLRGSVLDESGHGVPDAHVRVAENMFNGPGVDTDAGGHYELCTASGPLRLRVDADGYASLFVPAIASSAPPSVDVHLAAEGVVSGTIVRKETGAPIGRAQVNLWPFDPPSPSAPRQKDAVTRAPSSTIANEQGQFVVRSLAPGRYSINAWASDALAREMAFVDVRSREIKSGVVRRLETTSLVDARVLSSGRPVPGAAIMLVTRDTEGDQSSHGAVTQADGSVTLHGVFHGENQFRLKQYRVLAPAVLHVDQEHVGGVTVEVEPIPSAK